MKAAVYRKRGSSEVLSVEEIEDPHPGPGQVRVRISFSGVNPTDWKTRSGATGRDPETFQVPHQDGSGVIDEVGEGVSASRLGERVWVYLAAAGNPYGTAAQYCTIAEERAVPLPPDIPDEFGASLGVPGVTAAHCLGALGGGAAHLEGRSVLVAGGAGAVGHFAIELAKHAGARVASTVSSAQKAELARSAGADLVVDYKDAAALAQLQEFSARFDRVVEVAFGANLDLDLTLSGPGTVIVVYAAEPADPVLPTRRLMTANVTVHFVLLYSISERERQAAASWVSEALSAGALSVLPLHRYPLDQVAAAQDAVQAGAVGKVLVIP